MTRSRAITKPAARRPSLPSKAEFEGHVNGLRLALGRAEALTDALARHYDERFVGGVDPNVAERRVSHLIDMAAVATVEAFKELDLAGDSLGSGVLDADWGDS